MGPRCSSAETQVCHRSYIIAASLIGLSIRNGLAVRSEEQAKKVPKIFPTNEIARNKICSADLLNGHEWRKVGCVVENNLEFRQ